MNFALALCFFSLFYLVFVLKKVSLQFIVLIPTRGEMWGKWYLGHVCKTFLGDEFWISVFNLVIYFDVLFSLGLFVYIVFSALVFIGVMRYLFLKGEINEYRHPPGERLYFQ